MKDGSDDHCDCLHEVEDGEEDRAAQVVEQVHEVLVTGYHIGFGAGAERRLWRSGRAASPGPASGRAGGQQAAQRTGLRGGTRTAFHSRFFSEKPGTLYPSQVRVATHIRAIHSTYTSALFSGYH